MAMTGKPFAAGEGSMAKLFAGETAVWVTEQATQILGARGCSRDYPVERWHRDANLCTIFEGTSESQRLVIAARYQECIFGSRAGEHDSLDGRHPDQVTTSCTRRQPRQRGSRHNTRNRRVVPCHEHVADGGGAAGSTGAPRPDPGSPPGSDAPQGDRRVGSSERLKLRLGSICGASSASGPDSQSQFRASHVSGAFRTTQNRVSCGDASPPGSQGLPGFRAHSPSVEDSFQVQTIKDRPDSSLRARSPRPADGL